MDDDRSDFKTVNATEKDIDRIRLKDSIVSVKSPGIDSLKNLFEIIQRYRPKDGFTFYIITGEQMNDYYEFADDERFEEDSHLIVFMLDSLGDQNGLHSDMRQWGGRYLSDLVFEHQRLDTEEGQDRFRIWVSKRVTKALMESGTSKELSIEVGEYIKTRIFFEDGRAHFIGEGEEDQDGSGSPQDEP